LEQLKVGPPPTWQRRLAAIVVPVALVVGIGLVGLIIWAMVSAWR